MPCRSRRLEVHLVAQRLERPDDHRGLHPLPEPQGRAAPPRRQLLGEHLVERGVQRRGQRPGVDQLERVVAPAGRVPERPPHRDRHGVGVEPDHRDRLVLAGERRRSRPRRAGSPGCPAAARRGPTTAPARASSGSRKKSPLTLTPVSSPSTTSRSTATSLPPGTLYSPCTPPSVGGCRQPSDRTADCARSWTIADRLAASPRVASAASAVARSAERLGRPRDDGVADEHVPPVPRDLAPLGGVRDLLHDRRVHALPLDRRLGGPGGAVDARVHLAVLGAARRRSSPARGTPRAPRRGSGSRTTSCSKDIASLPHISASNQAGGVATTVTAAVHSGGSTVEPAGRPHGSCPDVISCCTSGSAAGTSASSSADVTNRLGAVDRVEHRVRPGRARTATATAARGGGGRSARCR